MVVRRVTRLWLLGGLVYAAVVVALTVSWMGPHGQVAGFRPTEVVTFVLTLPVSLLTLPVSYVVLAVVWNLTGADHGGPMWLVSVSYAMWFGLLAVANLALVVVVVGALRRRPAG